MNIEERFEKFKKFEESERMKHLKDEKNMDECLQSKLITLVDVIGNIYELKSINVHFPFADFFIEDYLIHIFIGNSFISVRLTKNINEHCEEMVRKIHRLEKFDPDAAKYIKEKIDYDSYIFYNKMTTQTINKSINDVFEYIDEYINKRLGN